MHDKLTGVSILISFGLAGVGYLLPQFILQKIVNRRHEKLDKALPDVIDLFVICMEAGLSLQATVNRVAEEIRPVCPEFYSELQITGGEMRTGIARDAALTNLGQRTGVQSVQSLVTLMNQSEKMGASIAQSLRVHADFVRTQRTLRAEEKAAQLPVKIMVPMVFFIFPALFIVILGPAVIRISQQLLPAMVGR
jgi:tight adherence protein C